MTVGLPPWVRLLRAPNPGPMTLEGTNTWVLGDARGSVVVDPGPLDEEHLRAVAAAAGPCVVLLTHRHADHTAGVDRFLEIAHPPDVVVLAADPALCRGGRPLVDGEELGGRAAVRAVVPDLLGSVRITVLATPGHTDDSVCLLVEDPSTGVVLTGDTVLGRGTSVVAHPDGRLRDYLRSLQLLQALGERPVLPGHGPVLPSVTEAAGTYLAHRLERLDQVRAAVAAGARSVEDVVGSVYADVAQQVRDAARRTVAAQLDYLREEGTLSGRGG